MAELRLTSELGINKGKTLKNHKDYDLEISAYICFVLLLLHAEHKFLHALDTLYQSGASATALERRDRTSLVGSYYSNGTPAVNNIKGGRPPQYPYPYSYPVATASNENAGGGMEGEKTEEEQNQMQVDEESKAAAGGDKEKDDASLAAAVPSGPAFSESRKKRSADKIEAKKQWLAVLNRAEMLTQSIQMARKKLPSDLNNRPSQVACFALLKDISCLPNLDLPPGGKTFVNAF